MPKGIPKGGKRKTNVTIYHRSVDRKCLGSTEAKAKMFSHYCHKNASYTHRQWFMMEHSTLHYIEHLAMTRLRYGTFPTDLEFLKSLAYAQEPNADAKVYVNEHYRCEGLREWIRRAFERYINYYTQASDAFPDILGADLIHCYFGFSEKATALTYSWCTETKQRLANACRRMTIRSDGSDTDDSDTEPSVGQYVPSTSTRSGLIKDSSTESTRPVTPELPSMM